MTRACGLTDRIGEAHPGIMALARAQLGSTTSAEGTHGGHGPGDHPTTQPPRREATFGEGERTQAGTGHQADPSLDATLRDWRGTTERQGEGTEQ